MIRFSTVLVLLLFAGILGILSVPDAGSEVEVTGDPESMLEPASKSYTPDQRSGSYALGYQDGMSRGTADEAGFRFVRIRYNSGRGGGRRWGRGYGTWAYDWPTAELNLHEAIDRTTLLHIEGEPIVLTLKDEEIFEHPVLYLTEPGYWITDDEEVAALQTYFERGGFMIIDDFHDYGDGQVGPQWNNFYYNIKQVFPDREPVELVPEHPIWSLFYNIDPVTAETTKRGGWLDMDDDTYYGIFDDNGRMMVVICYNQDIGDGWEWPTGLNLGQASTVSFQMAINFILYALTH